MNKGVQWQHVKMERGSRERFARVTEMNRRKPESPSEGSKDCAGL